MNVSEFNKFLRPLCRDAESYISINKKTNQRKLKHKKILSNQNIKNILAFLLDNKKHLTQNQLPDLRQLKLKLNKSLNTPKKFEKTASLITQEIEKCIKYINKQYAIKTFPKITSYQIAAAPHTRSGIEDNFRKILNYFPKYQFNNDLSVFDHSYGIPDDIDTDKIFNKIKQVKDKNQNATNIDLFKEILNIYKPVRPVYLEIIITENIGDDANNALRYNLETALCQGHPIITTKNLFEDKKDKLELSGIKIYSQINGNLILLLRNWEEGEKFGFNMSSFIPWTDFQQILVQEKWDLEKDFEEIFINSSEENHYKRLIGWHGHGSASDLTGNKGLIVGIKPKEFQSVLKKLAEKNMIFLCLSSCGLGGVNIQFIQMPNGTTPCPIMLEGGGIEDNVHSVQGASSFYRILKKATSILFPNYYCRNKFIISNKNLSYKDLKQIALEAPKYNSTQRKKFCVNNMITVIMPFSAPDTPKTIYRFPDAEYILDVEQKNKSDCITSSPSQKYLLFSRLQIESDIVCHNKKLTLISAGRETVHVIKLLIDEKIDLDTLIKNTLSKSGTARKTYFIKTLRLNNSFRNVLFTLDENLCFLLYKINCICYYKQFKRKKNNVKYVEMVNSNNISEELCNGITKAVFTSSLPNPEIMSQLWPSPCKGNITKEEAENIYLKLQFMDKKEWCKDKVLMKLCSLSTNFLYPDRLGLNYNAMEYADLGIRGDSAYMLDFLKYDSKFIEYIGDNLKHDYLFWSQALKIDNKTLYFAPKEIIEKALKHANIPISDSEYMLDLIQKKNKMINYIDNSLNNDYTFWLHVFKIKKDLLSYAPEAVKKKILIHSDIPTENLLCFF